MKPTYAERQERGRRMAACNAEIVRVFVFYRDATHSLVKIEDHGEMTRQKARRITNGTYCSVTSFPLSQVAANVAGYNKYALNIERVELSTAKFSDGAPRLTIPGRRIVVKQVDELPADFYSSSAGYGGWGHDE